MFEFECVVNFQDFVEWFNVNFVQLFLYSHKTFIKILWRRSLSYRNQFIDLLFEYVLNEWLLTVFFSSSSHGSLISFTFRILPFSLQAFLVTKVMGTSSAVGSGCLSSDHVWMFAVSLLVLKQDLFSFLETIVFRF